MGEIPLDIRNSAEALTKTALVSLLNHPVSTAQSLVMKSITAERERCAGIAERRAQDVRGSYGARYESGHIAMEIRSADRSKAPRGQMISQEQRGTEEMRELVEAVAKAIHESAFDESYDALSEEGIDKAFARQHAVAALNAVTDFGDARFSRPGHPLLQSEGAAL